MEKDKQVSKLLKDCGAFFAFSQEQFDKQRDPEIPEEDYLTPGVGLVIPKAQVKTFNEGMEQIQKYEQSTQFSHSVNEE